MLNADDDASSSSFQFVVSPPTTTVASSVLYRNLSLSGFGSWRSHFRRLDFGFIMILVRITASSSIPQLTLDSIFNVRWE